MHNRDQGSTECAKLRMNTLQKLRFGTKESRRKVANWPCGIEYPCENPRGAREWTKFKGIPALVKVTLVSGHLVQSPPGQDYLVLTCLANLQHYRGSYEVILSFPPGRCEFYGEFLKEK